MITDAIVSFLAWLVTTIIGWFPVVTPPAWVGNVGGFFTNIMDFAAGFGVWIPLQLTFQVAAAVLLCIVAGFGIRVVRWILSYFTGGGGSAG